MTVVDSSVWVDHFRGLSNAHTAWLQRARYTRPIAITDLILCEVLQGAPDEVRFSRMRRALLDCVVVPGSSRDIAILAARNYRTLRDMGITVRKTVDTLIATTCIERGLALLHHDRDFDPFEAHLGLKVIHPE